MAEEKFIAVGRRKESVARVTLLSGKGHIRINGRAVENYFPRESLRLTIMQPLKVVNLLNKFDIIAKVKGGGISGQAGAIRHGIARALLEVDAHLRPTLKKAGLITRDPRSKERKKYGQKGARKRFQWTKR